MCFYFTNDREDTAELIHECGEYLKTIEQIDRSEPPSPSISQQSNPDDVLTSIHPIHEHTQPILHPMRKSTPFLQKEYSTTGKVSVPECKLFDPNDSSQALNEPNEGERVEFDSTDELLRLATNTYLMDVSGSAAPLSTAHVNDSAECATAAVDVQKANVCTRSIRAPEVDVSSTSHDAPLAEMDIAEGSYVGFAQHQNGNLISI